MQSGCLRELGSKFYLIRNKATSETYPCFNCFILCEKSFLRKNMVLPIEKFLSLVLSRSVFMLQHHIVQFPFLDLLIGWFWEVKNKRKFQSFSSESGRGCFGEVFAYKKF